MDILLRNCRIVDPISNRDESGIDIEIISGVITAIGKSLKSNIPVKDLGGAVVAPGFESVAEHKILCFGVDVAALKFRCKPGEADLSAAVGAIDIQKARATGEAVRNQIKGDEGQ